MKRRPPTPSRGNDIDINERPSKRRQGTEIVAGLCPVCLKVLTCTEKSIQLGLPLSDTPLEDQKQAIAQQGLQFYFSKSTLGTVYFKVRSGSEKNKRLTVFDNLVQHRIGISSPSCGLM
ncbi:uncharacterized protein KY384_008506 [Bacidia gigantensis]|uniref:uncharacterized protein n=1 Tax=Bacidia gigantensis TaxID=2732470 RepID=UPI001D04511D|nr:uncharacterized protein KY384_008506 [Bacidia gigantensis]KAG8527077.1 hypothetical protein KY384_008506 [Bacidia gigantensis]